MRATRMLIHAAAFAALGVMCMAQSGTGQSGSMGQAQQGMGQQQQENRQGTMRQGDTGAPSSMSDNASRHGTSPDHAFITKAAQGGLAEVTLGNLAEQNASSDAVKQFGSKMVTDHSKANDELRQIADQKGITLPSHMDAKDKQMSQMLESKKGQAFDKAYTRDMVKDHEADIAEFRKEAEYGKDPAVKAWAQQTLPILEQHLTLAKQVAGEVGSEKTSKSAGAMSSHQ